MLYKNFKCYQKFERKHIRLDVNWAAVCAIGCEKQHNSDSVMSKMSGATRLITCFSFPSIAWAWIYGLIITQTHSWRHKICPYVCESTVCCVQYHCIKNETRRHMYWFRSWLLLWTWTLDGYIADHLMCETSAVHTVYTPFHFLPEQSSMSCAFIAPSTQPWYVWNVVISLCMFCK